MNKVYIVIAEDGWDDLTGPWNHSVWSTKELAEEAIESISKKLGYNYKIEEWEVDA